MLALVAGAVGGLLLFRSFPPGNWWWSAPLAFVLLGVAWRGRGPRVGALSGAATGMAFFVPLLSWTGEFVGAAPWLVLATLQALFVVAVGAAVGSLADRWWWPIPAAAVWIAGEAVRGRVPFGGFPWGRVGFGQSEGPFTAVAALGGVPLLGFVVATAGFALHGVLRAAAPASRSSALLRLARAFVPLALPAVVAVAAVPVAAPPPVERTAVVALVQGNVPRLGLDFNAQRRAVLDNHVRRTEELAADVRAGRLERPDFVLWPENSADIDPLRNPDARAAVDAAVRAIGVPILVGAVLTPPGSSPTNTMIAWEPGSGPGETHDKRRLQPFGEYVPYRTFFRLFSPLVERSSNFVPGEGDSALRLGDLRIGIATCYEVIFDDLVREAVGTGGGELLVVPSNNATFGWTDMTYQQLAIDRVRAVELGRSTLVPTTSGVSAVVMPDGSVRSESERFVPAVLIERIPLRRDSTPATRAGALLEGLVVGGAVMVVGASSWSARQRRGLLRRASSSTTSSTERRSETGSYSR